MKDPIWTVVDEYLESRLIPDDPVLEAALRASAEAGLPPIQVSAAQGKLLYLIARLAGARRILEIGTLGGYSTIWLARALRANGRLISLELERKHAEVARANLARAGLAGRVELRVGPAAASLQALAEPPAGAAVQPFDLVFIDADKPSTAEYFKWAVELTRPGSVIIVDNVIRMGAIADSGSDDPSVRGMRRFFDAVAEEPRVSATAIQTVGTKGYDGFAILERL